MTQIQESMNACGLLWLRVLTGLGMSYHGYGKIFGGHMDGFTQAVSALGFPAPEFFAWMAALSEFAGGILLALGLLGPLAALLIFFTMTTAVFLQHGDDPFKEKELAIAYWVASGVLVLTGPGKYSLDGLRKSKKQSKDDG